jgi:excisionase family DNA binding protein
MSEVHPRADLDATEAPTAEPSPEPIPGQLTLTLIPERPLDDTSVSAHGEGAPPRPEMLDKQDLARYFGVSVDTIERLVKAGELAAVRVGSQVRFTLEDVDGFIARHRTRERTS